jgi:hypothetical protein
MRSWRLASAETGRGWRQRDRLLDWEQCLGDRIKSVTARYTNEHAKLMLERELLQEQL